MLCQSLECSQNINEENIRESSSHQIDINQRENNANQDSTSIEERRIDAIRRAREAVQMTRQIAGENSDVDFEAMEIRLLRQFLAEAVGQYQDEFFDIVNTTRQPSPVLNVEDEEQNFVEIYSIERSSSELSNIQDSEELSFNNYADREIFEEISSLDKNGNKQEDIPFAGIERNFSESSYSR